MILQATHTHLYPGHRGTVFGLARSNDLQTDADCLVEFSDGSATAARLSRSGNGWRLDTGAYRTTAGTHIPEKHWLIQLEDSHGQVAYRILEKTQRG